LDREGREDVSESSPKKRTHGKGVAQALVGRKLPGRQLCSLAGLCPAASCGKDPVGHQEAHENMNLLEAVFEELPFLANCIHPRARKPKHKKRLTLPIEQN